MQLGFDTESVEHARAALLLYAMYKSRETKSSLNGIETWDRCNSYIKGAVCKSSTTGEFAQEFCKKANINSIKPQYLKTDGLVNIDNTGTMIQADGIYNYQTSLFENTGILNLLSKESLYIIMLVRERIQREKGGFDET